MMLEHHQLEEHREAQRQDQLKEQEDENDRRERPQTDIEAGFKNHLAPSLMDFSATASHANSLAGSLAGKILPSTAESPIMASSAARNVRHSHRQTMDRGKDKVFDIFISYRVSADAKLVESLYDKLKAMQVVEGGKRRPLRVFWDKVCLIAGEDFERGFSRALCNSRLVVFVMSRAAYQNIQALTENSSCDNFILEHALTLELVDNKRVSAVLPLFVGDLKSYEGVGCLYSNFFQSNCLPRNIPGIVLSSVQEKVCDSLSRLGIEGSSPRTLNQIFKEITQFQGVFLEGAERAAIEHAVSVIHECSCRQLEEESDNLRLQHFRFATPLGQEVCDWLNSNMLAAFAPTFSKHKIDSLHKASMMTREQVDAVHLDFCENLAQLGSRKQVGSQIALQKAINGLKKDERAFSCTDRLDRYKDANVAWRMAIGTNNQIELLLSKAVWRLWIFGFTLLAVPGVLTVLISLSVIFDASILFGRPPSKMTSMRIFVGVNGSDWRAVDCGKGPGVQCQILTSDIPFSQPEYARFIRIFPAEWEPDMHVTDPAMKLGILGTPDVSFEYAGGGIGDRLDYLVLGSGTPGEYWLEDACTRDAHAPLQGKWAPGEEKLGKVQCCLSSPDLHVCTRDGCLSGHANVTWKEAKLMCESKGWRLCSRAELTVQGSSGCCTNNKCGYDNELVWTSTHAGVQLQQCSKHEHCNYPSCRGWCVDGSCFKGSIDTRCQDKTDSHELEDGRWCWQGFSGYHCPTQLGLVGGQAPIIFESRHEHFLTLDIHTPKFITKIVIQGGAEQSPLIFTSSTCATQFLSIPLTFGPITVMMLLISRTSPMKGSRCLVPGLIWCHLFHGFILFGMLYEYLTGAIPSVISTNFTCRTWGAWTIRSHALLSFSLYVCPPALIFLHLVRPKYLLVCMLSLWGVVTTSMIGLGFEWWFQWLVLTPFLSALIIFLSLTYILRARTQREAFHIGQHQTNIYESVWEQEIGASPTMGGADGQLVDETFGAESVVSKPNMLKRRLSRADSTIRPTSLNTSPDVQVRAAHLGRVHADGTVLDHIAETCRGLNVQISQTRERELQSYSKSCPWYRNLIHKLGAGGMGLYSMKGKRRQRSENLDLLFEEASTLNDPFFELIQDLFFAGNTSSGTINGKATQGPAKRADRALQKTVRKYFRDPRCLTDLVRCCVILDSIQDMDKCLDEIFLRTVVDDTSSDLVYHVPGKRNDSASNRLDSIDCNRLFKLTKVKDRFSSSDRLGYRDICLNLEVGWTISSEMNNEQLDFVPVGLWGSDAVRMHICEVQLILKSTYEVKATGGHDTFVEVRNLISA